VRVLALRIVVVSVCVFPFILKPTAAIPKVASKNAAKSIGAFVATLSNESTEMMTQYGSKYAVYENPPTDTPPPALNSRPDAAVARQSRRMTGSSFFIDAFLCRVAGRYFKSRASCKKTRQAATKRVTMNPFCCLVP
jgi:hypothetical protein